MGAKTTTEDAQSEEVVNDLQEEVKEVKSDELDIAKLASLRAKSQAKQQEQKMANKIVAKKERSLALGVLGTGHAGSRLSSEFAELGYSAICCNTAPQDLRNIPMQDSCKLLLEGTLGGASKERSIGKAAAENNKSALSALVNDKLASSQVNVLCTSLGGGSGSGSIEVCIDVLRDTGKPIVVIAVLPMGSEDAQTKHNALEALGELAHLVQAKVVSSLFVVDNEKLESVLSHVNQMDFYKIANKTIAEELDAFNTYSMLPSSVKALDSAEWAKILVDSEGLSIFGSMEVRDYLEDTAIAEAIMSNLDGNLLAEGFDLKQCKYAGFIIAASEATLKELPVSSVNYASAILTDKCGQPKGVFKGVYAVPMEDGVVKVHSIFAGMGLPSSRVEHLKKDAQSRMQEVKAKEESRNLNLQLDTGSTQATDAAAKIREKIAQKSSAFGKLMGGSTGSGVVDRRKK